MAPSVSVFSAVVSSTELPAVSNSDTVEQMKLCLMKVDEQELLMLVVAGSDLC